jgi:hypothetical protein
MSEPTVLLAIECDHCGAYTEEALSWLRNAPSMGCSCCGARLDLSIGDTRALIDDHVRLKERLDDKFQLSLT